MADAKEGHGNANGPKVFANFQKKVDEEREEEKVKVVMATPCVTYAKFSFAELTRIDYLENQKAQ